RIGILMGAYKQPAAPSFLIDGLIDRHRGLRNDVLIIEVGHHSDNAARLRTDADELDHPVGPPHGVIHRVLTGVKHLRKALADDHDALVAFLVPLVKVAAIENRNTHGGEESRRDGAELRAELVLAILLPVRTL